MPVRNGIGQSEATSDKEDALRAILQQHLAVVRRIFEKGNWMPHVYRYIDANAGCGHNELVDCAGSPLVFMDAVDKVPLPHYAHFVEIDAQNAMLLQAAIGDRNHHEVLVGDNREIVPDIIAGLPRNSYGLLYTDPNGVPDFDLLGKLSRLPQMRYMDILIRYSASAVKRNIHQTGEHLIDHLTKISKSHWIVRELDRGDKWQWTFLMGLNWGGLSEMQHLGFHYARSDRGQDILERLNHTNEELAAIRQPSLFQADPPYSTYDEYLRHPQFRAIRALAIRRASGVCERCSRRAVTEVHHLQYPPWGEFDVPENLLAVCHECHCEIHGKEN